MTTIKITLPDNTTINAEGYPASFVNTLESSDKYIVYKVDDQVNLLYQKPAKKN